MGEFIKRLGKFVQGLLDKIRGKKEQEIESCCIIGTTDDNNWFEVTQEEWDKCQESYNAYTQLLDRLHEPIEFTIENAIIDEKALEKFVNIPRTNLPKRYCVKTLIITLAANQDSEYQMVDMSQYEERGIAHYVIGSTKSKYELEKQYYEETGDDEELGGLWTGDTCSAVVGPAILWHYEELGIWDFEP